MDRDRSGLNRRLIGGADWALQGMLEIREMTMETYAAELEYLDRRKDRAAIRRRTTEGPRDPWRASRHGPLREVILIANKAWFDETGASDELFDTWREDDFEALAVGWLKENFGDDVIHARADRDEQAYHIHAVILPRATVRKYGAECRMLRPSIHPLIRDYEAAQDSVGEWFSEIGLVCGERRKQAIREALQDGRTPPANRRHVRPANWRAQEELRLAKAAAAVEKRKRAVAERENEAEDVLAFADGVAAETMDETGQPLPDKAGESQPVSFPPQRKAGRGFARARKAFSVAFERLRKRARQDAERAAAARIVTELADIKRADQAILDIARLLPKGLRTKVAQARRVLTARIMVLERTTSARKPEPGPRDGRSQ